MPGIKPGTAGCKARWLPLCYAVPSYLEVLRMFGMMTIGLLVPHPNQDKSLFSSFSVRKSGLAITTEKMYSSGIDKVCCLILSRLVIYRPISWALGFHCVCICMCLWVWVCACGCGCAFACACMCESESVCMCVCVWPHMCRYCFLFHNLRTILTAAAIIGSCQWFVKTATATTTTATTATAMFRTLDWLDVSVLEPKVSVRKCRKSFKLLLREILSRKSEKRQNFVSESFRVTHPGPLPNVQPC